MTSALSSAPRALRPRRVLPGFAPTMGVTLFYLALVVLLPLAALFLKSAEVGPARFWAIVTGPRALASFAVTLTAAFAATVFNAFYGLLMAWVLVRYQFPGKRILDALMDLPFALPTSVAGVALATLYAGNGWFGAPLQDAGIKVANSVTGIAIAMAFTSAPFVIRTVQPVLEDLSADVEEAARTLGAWPFSIFIRVVWPAILPAFITGLSLAFARALGEFGAVIFIAGNLPLKTEIAALLIFIRLEEFDYPAAASIAVVLLVTSFVVLLLTNVLQAWTMRHAKVPG